MLSHEVTCLGLGFDLADEVRPIQGACANVGPAIFIGLLTGRRDVLDVDCSDAAAQLIHPEYRIFFGADDPGQVHFPLRIGGRVKDKLNRRFAVGILGEFPVVVVVAKAFACSFKCGGNLGQALGKFLPIATAGAEGFGGRRRAINGLNADSVGDLERRVGVLKLAKAHMGGRHGQACILQALGKGRRVLELAAPALDLGIAQAGQGLEGVVERRLVAGAVKLIRKVHDWPRQDV